MSSHCAYSMPENERGRECITAMSHINFFFDFNTHSHGSTAPWHTFSGKDKRIIMFIFLLMLCILTYRGESLVAGEASPFFVFQVFSPVGTCCSWRLKVGGGRGGSRWSRGVDKVFKDGG